MSSKYIRLFWQTNLRIVGFIGAFLFALSEQKNESVQPSLIEPKLNDLLIQYSESNQNIVEKLENFHIEFKSIHQFIDGDGRTGILIVKLELMKAGFPPTDIKFTDRMRYYNAFDDKKEMTKLFAEHLNKRLDEYLCILD